MKLSCKRIDFTYTPGEEIFNFPEESGLPFIFDVEEELTGDPAAMDAVGEMLDEAEKLAEKAKTAIKAALADEDSRYHSVVTFFMEFHRDDVGSDIAAELFPGSLKKSLKPPIIPIVDSSSLFFIVIAKGMSKPPAVVTMLIVPLQICPCSRFLLLTLRVGLFPIVCFLRLPCNVGSPHPALR